MGKLVIEDGGQPAPRPRGQTVDDGRLAGDDKSLGMRKYGLKEVRFCI